MITSKTVLDFAKIARDAGDHVTVRRPHYSEIAAFWPRNSGVRELRTRKHDHAAVAWDVLGNATVLTARGEIRQYIGEETRALPR